MNNMRLNKVFCSILLLAFFASIICVAPVMAIGPTKAAEVGKNPHLIINPINQRTMLDNPNGDFCALDRVVWYGETINLHLNASNTNGLNNAIDADISIVEAMSANPHDFENKWIYLSGENYGNAYDGHGMFYWWLISEGYSHEQALTALDRAADGCYLKSNYVGP